MCKRDTGRWSSGMGWKSEKRESETMCTMAWILRAAWEARADCITALFLVWGVKIWLMDTIETFDDHSQVLCLGY